MSFSCEIEVNEISIVADKESPVSSNRYSSIFEDLADRRTIETTFVSQCEF